MSKKNKDKRLRWEQFPDRLKDALISNVHANQLDNLKYNVSLLRTNLFDDGLKSKLLTLSLTNASKECALFLIEQGAICNPSYILSECKYDKIHIVYELVDELVDEFPDNFTGSGMNKNKKYLIKRILDPSKINENPHRIDYLMSNTKFFSTKEIKQCIDEEYKSKPEKWSALISLLRDIKLKELGI